MAKMIFDNSLRMLAYNLDGLAGALGFLFSVWPEDYGPRIMLRMARAI